MIRWPRLLFALVIGLAWLATALPAGAQAPRPEPRLALLIGNSGYKESPLRNPVNDVRAMAQRLRELAGSATGSSSVPVP